MESSSRSRSLRSLAAVLLITLSVLIGLNQILGGAEARPAPDYALESNTDPRTLVPEADRSSRHQ